jgi:hypothetical protein
MEALTTSVFILKAFDTYMSDWFHGLNEIFIFNEMSICFGKHIEHSMELRLIGRKIWRTIKQGRQSTTTISYFCR